ncbi:hypothetical protein [Candidatus Oscillochloris fontis]|uniref:hypothetical protein n=1 Tax=Candidatus Oscillochloris fontis TaxID=2496868 RepID=UPI00101E1A1E|nr:hypothetical protein [Candidatus Oscillochloris fontis]
MIHIEQSVGVTHLPPSSDLQPTCERNTTLIILERDGTISHSATDIAPKNIHRARVELPADLEAGQPAPSMIERVLDFACDILGIRNLEVRIYEPQKR